MKAIVKHTKGTYEINNIINVVYAHGNMILTSCDLSTGKMDTQQFTIESLQFGQVIIVND